MYVAIDLKSFYASVECVERNLDPLTTNLVVADSEKTEKTICLAVSPSLKSYGIPGRARLFEVVKKAKEANIDYIVASPRMALYMEYSKRIYEIYLRYVSEEDIHVYSVDEVFIDLSDYLQLYKKTEYELASDIVKDIIKETGITATVGIGTNLYLCKIAMDIVAKHMEPDENGIRLAFLDEVTYRKTLWNHRPLRDFWRVGSGYSKKLEEKGLFTMGDIARCSIGKNTDYYNEDLLYKMFGINAELLIDHAWGYEPCTIKDIKKFKPVNNSISNGQVLQKPYNYEDAKLIIKEMTDELSLELVDRGIITNQLVLDIGYDIVSADSAVSRGNDIKSDRYGRNVPKPAHGSINLKEHTSSGRVIINAMMELYDRIVNKSYYIRRMSVTANHVIFETEYKKQEQYKQLDLFSYMEFEENEKNKKAEEEKDKDMQKAVLKVKKKYGKNSLVKGMSLLENATAMDRNKQIGGHKA